MPMSVGKPYNKGQWQARGKKCDICAGNATSFILIAIVMSEAVSGFDVRMQLLQSKLVTDGSLSQMSQM